jgi:hypothetical protein
MAGRQDLAHAVGVAIGVAAQMKNVAVTSWRRSRSSSSGIATLGP